MVRFTNELLNLIEGLKDQEYVIAGDTDSIYVRMDAVLKKLFGTTKINWNDEKTFLTIKDYVDNDFQIKLNDYCADFICGKFFTDQRRIQFKR